MNIHGTRRANVMKSRTIAMVVVAAIFLCCNILYYTYSIRDAAIAFDSSDYLSAARRLIQEGVYHSEYRLPVYPIFISCFMLCTQEIQPYVIWVQILMLFGTAWIAGRITESFCPGLGIFVIVLTAFNPNAILHAHRVLPDALFSFLFVLFVLYLIRSIHTQSSSDSVRCGILAGLLALTRGNGVYLIGLMPCFLVIVSRIVNPKGPHRIRSVALALFAASLPIIPWVCYSWRTRGQPRINSPDYVSFAVHDNLQRIESLAYGLPRSEAAEAIRGKAVEKAGLDPQKAASLNQQQIRELARAHAGSILLDYPPGTLLYAGVRSIANFFLDPGYKDFTGQLTLPSLQLPSNQLGVHLTARTFLSQLFLNRSPAARMYALFIAVTVILRGLAVAGLAACILHRNWPLLILCGGLILFFAIISGLIAYARYRLPIDPLLYLVAVYGVASLVRSCRRNTDGDPPCHPENRGSLSPFVGDSDSLERFSQ